MFEVEKLLDAELRDELAARGVNVGPVVATTRLFYEKKLKKLMAGSGKRRPKTDTTQNSTFNRSEIEDMSGSDEVEEEEILSPKPKSRQTSFTRRPVSSTPTKILSPNISPSIHVPNLITEFTPSFSKFRIATSPRSHNFNDEDDLEGIESSRIIHNDSRGLGMTAWKKVLGTPRSKNRKKPNVFNDAVWVALYALLIVLAALIAAVFVTSNSEQKYWSVLKAAASDSMKFFYNYAILPLVFIAALILIFIGLYIAHRKYKKNQEEEEAKLYDLIDKITELVEQSDDSYVSQPHVRDLLFPPSKRRAPEMARWQKAVEFIDAQESRISTDVTILPSGNECAVWKWIGRQNRNFKNS